MSNPNVRPAVVSDAAVSEQLRSLLNENDFQRSRNLARLIKYMVNEELAGRGDRLSGKLISMEVFKRPPDQNDSLARVEISRLRKTLRRYYAKNPDEVVIQIPTGAYRPRFSKTTTATSQALRLFVPDFEADSKCADLALHSTLVFKQTLARYGELDLVEAHPAQIGSETNRVDSHYSIKGRLIEVGQKLQCHLQLFHVATDRSIWHQAFPLQNKSDLNAIERAADTLMSMSGPLMAHAFRVTRYREPHQWSAVDCLIIWHGSRLRLISPETQDQLFTRILELLREHPEFALGHAMHAHLLVDRFANRVNGGEKGQMLNEARSIIARAIALDSNNAQIHMVAAGVEFFDDNPAEFHHHMDVALQLAPHAQDLLYTGSLYMALLGEREKGAAMIARTDSASLSRHSSALLHGHAIYTAILEDNLERAATLVDRTDKMSGWYLLCLTTAVCAEAVGDWKASEQAYRRAVALAPALPGNELRELGKWVKHPRLLARCETSLQSLLARID